MRWFVHCLRHYADFDGRASRREYWENYGVGMGFSALLLLLGIPLHVFLYGWALFQIATFLPTLAVTVRRLHDIGLHSYWASLYAISFFALGWGAFTGMLAFSQMMSLVDGDPDTLLNGKMTSLFNGIENLMTVGESLSTLIFILVCRKGISKPNRYGQVPSSHAPL